MSKTVRLINEGFFKKYVKDTLDENTSIEIGPVKASSDLGTTALNTVGGVVNKAIDNIEPIAKGASAIIPLLADDASEKEEIEKVIFHNDNGEDYEVIERSKSGQNALLNRGKQWIIAWNCPQSNEGSWGQGHYFFDEESAREVWQDKYLNESLTESYSVVDLETGDRFGNYDDVDFAKTKAVQYCTKFKAQAAVVDSDFNLIAGYNRSGKEIKQRNEALDNNGRDRLKRFTYNALSDVMFEIGPDAEEADLKAAIDFFFDKFFNSDAFEEKLKECIDKLTEAEMSDEDKHDTELLRSIYKKIDGKRIGTNTFTPEEKDIINKYGLDVWGYRGDSKIVTDKGRKDVVNKSETNHYYGSRNDKFSKINYADRARKIDDRDYAQKVNRRKGWDQSFDDAEKELQQRELTQNVNRMKSALSSRKYHQSELDDAEKKLDTRLSSIDKEFTDKINKVKERTDDNRRFHSKYGKEAQSRIDQILDKHRVKECLHQLKEAEMSDEDKADSAVLRNIYRKIQNRSNAALTPEEKAVIDKYDLRRVDKNLTDNKYNNFLFNASDEYDYDRRYYGYHKPTASPRGSKINYADKARKLDQREYAKSINNMSDWGYGKSFQNKERAKINQELGKDVDNMKSALSDRRWHNDGVSKADAEYDAAVLGAAKDRDIKIQQAHQSSKDQIKYHKQSLDKANKDIKKLLNKEESLKEAKINKEEARIVDTGLYGEINKDILESVIGQISDGIWENSPGMEGYWMGADIDDDCNIITSSDMYIKSWKNYIKNPYYNMTDTEVRRYFANKIKQICQEYLNDNNLNPYTGWNADSEEVCTYLGHGRDVTIADAYAAYKALK